MKDAAHPTSFSRRRGRGRNILTERGPSHKNYQNKQNKASLHEALNSPKMFSGLQNWCQTIYELANVFAVDRHEKSLCIRMLPGFCAD